MIGEPLIPDRRLALIEQEIRKLYPNLPEGCEFATFRQPAMTVTLDNGVIRPIADVAVFAIVVTNPRTKTPSVFARQDWLKSWLIKDREYRHSGEVQSDPVYRAYMARLQPPAGDGKTLPEQIIDWHRNVMEMN